MEGAYQAKHIGGDDEPNANAARWASLGGRFEVT
jgi:hypothetical protein